MRARVIEGGHNIPKPVIIRRYYSGLSNLFQLYIPVCDYWMIFNNSVSPSVLIADGNSNKNIEVKNEVVFETIKKLARYDKEG